MAEQLYLGCWAYPTVQEVKAALLSINPDFEVILLGDMLLAYDPAKANPQFSETVKACTKTRFYDGYNLNDKELFLLEEKIKNALPQEKEYIKKLYDQMTGCKDPMFWHDFWYGLVALGSANYQDAHAAFAKVQVRIQHLNQYKKIDKKIIIFDHPRIKDYLEVCARNIH